MILTRFSELWNNFIFHTRMNRWLHVWKALECCIIMLWIIDSDGFGLELLDISLILVLMSVSYWILKSKQTSIHVVPTLFASLKTRHDATYSRGINSRGISHLPVSLWLPIPSKDSIHPHWPQLSFSFSLLSASSQVYKRESI